MMDYKEKKYFRDIKMALRKLSEIGVPITPIIKAVMNAESELAESEDERIRRELIQYHTDGMKDSPWFTQTLRHQDVLAWLENKKEQKDYRKLYEDIAKSEWFKKAYVGKSLGEEDEKEEQKPIEWSAYDKATIEYIIEDIKGLRDEETDEEVIETYDRELNLLQCINDSVKLCNYTNPAEWSEEDEKLFNNVLSGLKYAHEDLINNKSLDSAKDIKEAFDWMQARMKNFRPQPEPEWSEEDDEMCLHIRLIVNMCNAKSSTIGPMLKWLNDLHKRCKVQPHWKPSEEQMEALRVVLEHEAERMGSSYELSLANSLYEQLKAWYDGEYGL